MVFLPSTLSMTSPGRRGVGGGLEDFLKVASEYLKGGARAGEGALNPPPVTAPGAAVGRVPAIPEASSLPVAPPPTPPLLLLLLLLPSSPIMAALKRFTQVVEAREARPRDTRPLTPAMQAASTSMGEAAPVSPWAGPSTATTTVAGMLPGVAPWGTTTGTPLARKWSTNNSSPSSGGGAVICITSPSTPRATPFTRKKPASICMGTVNDPY